MGKHKVSTTALTLFLCFIILLSKATNFNKKQQRHIQNKKISSVIITDNKSVYISVTNRIYFQKYKLK